MKNDQHNETNVEDTKIISLRAEINELDSQETIKNINKNKSWFFEKETDQ